EADDEQTTAPAPALHAAAAATSAPPPPNAAAPPPEPSPDKKPALGMDEFRERWKKKANKQDDFPTGYFATDDGTMMGLRIVSPTTGTGDRGGDELLDKVKKIVSG